MSNLLATRKVPLMIAAGVFGGLLYTTYGGVQQPRPRSTHDNAHDATGGTLSEAAQAAAGTGGARARSGDDMEALRQYDPKDTRLHSKDPGAQSKREPGKVRGEEVGA
ncbi:uncharacterized protein B0H64DRAFT_472691 [Chaetomium fimeti]|uniref:Uncharacterized protein n=1 Tax=Chaetomium fimeti TaxID=1854472 RepID=A0AAE0HN30_9PEZI|nr:hypothetical protein B0H64DRAFT_472691 [Chaetomium fimeti]